jgi:CO/xanthine dehydrogenase FAD-binding subunit
VLVSLPVSLEEAFDAFERCPDAQLLAGGTDFMVEVNFALRRPPAVVCLRKVEELKGWRLEGSEVVLGAGLTYTELMAPRLSDLVPGLVQASRTVGSPQIRNAGTLGGNLGTASPAGDSLPVLAALDAKIVVASKQGRRSLALGSVGPVVIRARDAEELISSRIDWTGRTLPGDGDLTEFTALVRSAARPIDDHRSTADYRRHAVGVCAQRALERVFANHNGETLERTSWAS